MEEGSKVFFISSLKTSLFLSFMERKFTGAIYNRSTIFFLDIDTQALVQLSPFIRADKTRSHEKD